MKPFDNVVVSATEPKNKANIWIKHGKNLFNAIIEQGGISDLGANNAGNNRLRTLGYIFLKKGTYTLSFTGLEYSGGYLYNTNGTFNKLLWAWTTGNKTFTIENDSLMRFTFRKSDNAEITPDVVKNIQIEVGLEATEYEAPVEDDILINNSGVYRSILHYKRMILWKNDNPKNTMGEQYLNLFTDDYDWIELICVRDNVEVTGNLFIISTGIIPKKGHFYLSESLGFDNDYSKIITRAVQYVNDKQYIAFPGRVQASNSKTRSTDNSYLIPLYIIGYKFN